MTDQELEKFLQASKRRFDEHLSRKYKRKYPDIEKFIEGQATKDISKFIPVDYLKKLVWHYWLFNIVTQKPANPKRSPQNYPSKEISSIKATLEDFCNRKWFQDTDVEEIIEFINVKMLQSPKGRLLRIEQQKNPYRGKKGGRWENHALKFAIYFLVQYAREVKRRPCYKEITNFLEEQYILKSQTAVTYAQKFSTNIKPQKIRTLYMFLMMNFEGDWFDKWVQANKTQHLKYEVQSYCLPDFDDFYPLNWKKKNLPE